MSNFIYLFSFGSSNYFVGGFMVLSRFGRIEVLVNKSGLL